MKRNILEAVIVILLAIVIGTGAYLGNYYRAGRRGDKLYVDH
jgi:hypothetical protein